MLYNFQLRHWASYRPPGAEGIFSLCEKMALETDMNKRAGRERMANTEKQKILE